jgi:kynurenine 3-monooxygenase
MEDTVVVVGAGLSGSLMALMLAQRQYKILVVEKRPHPNANKPVGAGGDKMLGMLTDSAKRSINLALSYRGTEALKAAGLYGYVEPSLLPMRGRFVHPLGGGLQFQPYGKNDQAIYSVSRQTLNELLLAKLEDNKNVSLKFDTKVARINNDGAVLLKQRGQPDEVIKPRLVIGADGGKNFMLNTVV